MNATAIWLMAIGMGLYQGLNPPMGWLAAVARSLERRSLRAGIASAWACSLGHFCAMAALLVPIAALCAVASLDSIQLMRLQVAASYSLIAFGVFKFARPQHPRFLARIPPERLVRRSFLMAATHCGSPLMMVPSFSLLASLASSAAGGTGIARAGALIALAILQCAAMAFPLFLVSAATAATVVKRFGLRALTRYWVNFDLGWAALFVAMGIMGLTMGGLTPANASLPRMPM